MFKTKRFEDRKKLDEWLNGLQDVHALVEIVGYQALYLGSALGIEFIVTVHII
jgi:hypothetical protein